MITGSQFVAAASTALSSAPMSYNSTITISYRDGLLTIQIDDGQWVCTPVGQSATNPNWNSGGNVSIQERLRVIFDGIRLSNDLPCKTICYYYDRGLEEVNVGNSVIYCGRYHPNGACEGEVVCTWCGVVL